jgi:uncharacterized protein (DUF427 family)
MAKAIWKGKILAESNKTIEIEGNAYFPPEAIKKEYFKESTSHSTCPWKGEASYYDVLVDGETNKDAAWFYPKPLSGSLDKVGKDFSNYVAFWKGVKITY